MTHDELVLCASVLIATATLLFAYFIYDRETRNSVIMQDAEEDFQEVSRKIHTCHPSEAERLILEFEDKWSRYLMPWTLSDYTHKLYRILFDRDIRAKLN
jgi:hypothetical protein